MTSLMRLNLVQEMESAYHPEQNYNRLSFLNLAAILSY